MKNKNELMVYTAPQVEFIEVEVEKGFASSIDYLYEEEWD